MENTNKVPAAFPITAVIIFALMFAYAALWDPSFPEKSVKGFYQSYFAQDYQGASENLSVLWANQLVPEYAAVSRADLMEQRADVTAQLAAVLESAQAFAPAAENVKVEVLMDSIVKGKASALVAYNIFEGDAAEPVSTNVALLAKEGQSYKLLASDTIDAEYLPLVKTMDMSVWDEFLNNL